VTWPTSVPILVFLGLCVLDLGPMYATDRRQIDFRRASSLNAPYPGAGHNNCLQWLKVRKLTLNHYRQLFNIHIYTTPRLRWRAGER